MPDPEPVTSLDFWGLFDRLQSIGCPVRRTITTLHGTYVELSFDWCSIDAPAEEPHAVLEGDGNA